MKKFEKRQLYGLLEIGVISAVITAIFMYFIYYRGWQSIGAGLSIGFSIPLAISLYTENFFKRYLIRTHLIVMLIVNTLAHLIIIVVISTLFVGIFYMKADFKYMFSNPDHIFNRFFAIGISFGVFLSLAFNFFAILNTLIGKHILGRLFIGMYRHPREVDRVFMFIDINNSTAIAEKIGHLKFMSMVNDFFFDLAEPVRNTRGEIYKYVGDEAIITWNSQDALLKGNCIQCFLNIQDRIQTKIDHYQSKYGVVPDFKAGIHGGLVITGELGYTKREIAFMGDILNTTSRIEETCKTLNEPLLISKSIVDQLKGKSNYNFREVGPIKLRGKEKELVLYGIESANQFFNPS
ncbi:MAG: adenylate/guanylate cyclase domain-containing protein [Bacteroidetes bacterium]|nr:adenylate/guanylate cyclase domain-containing protein [Bacteroidota bacterium]